MRLGVLPGYMHLVSLCLRDPSLFWRCLLLEWLTAGPGGEFLLFHESANVLLPLLIELDQKSLEVLLILLLDRKLLLLEKIVEHG